MKINFNQYRSMQLRTSVAKHESEDGAYQINELAIVDNIDGNNYVTSVGVAFRKDEMSSDVKARREELGKSKSDKKD